MGTVALGVVAVHPIHSGWAQSQAIIRAEINSRIAYDSVVITNWNLTGKFFDLLLGRHFPKSRDQLRPTDVGYLIQSYPEVLAVMLDRTDSASARKDVETNASFNSRWRSRPASLATFGPRNSSIRSRSKSTDKSRSFLLPAAISSSADFEAGFALWIPAISSELRWSA